MLTLGWAPRDAYPPPCVTFRLVVAPLQGPGQSPVLPFACCVGSLRSVGRCGRCSCWRRFRVRGAQWLVCWGCAECGMVCPPGLGPLFVVVLTAGLGVCDAFVEGKGGSFISVTVQSVHHNIVPHIAAPCGLFGCDFRPRLTLLFPAWLSHPVLCCRVCVAQAPDALVEGALATVRARCKLRVNLGPLPVIIAPIKRPQGKTKHCAEVCGNYSQPEKNPREGRGCACNARFSGVVEEALRDNVVRGAGLSGGHLQLGHVKLRQRLGAQRRVQMGQHRVAAVLLLPEPDQGAEARDDVALEPRVFVVAKAVPHLQSTGDGALGRPQHGKKMCGDGGEGGGGGMTPWACFGLQPAAPIGRLPLTALPLPRDPDFLA